MGGTERSSLREGRRGLVAVLLFLVVTVVVGAAGLPAAAAQEAGLLRVAHLSPDTPAVDVALTPLPADGAGVTDPGPDVATSLGYGSVSSYDQLPAGRYAVSIRAAGSPATTPPVLTAEVDLAAGAARTVVVGGRFADLTLQAVPDDLSAPPPGSAHVRVLAAADGAGPLDVTLGGLPLARRLPFATVGRYVAVPAGTAPLDVAGRPVTGRALELAAGSVLSLLVLDGPDGGLDVRTVVDAAGPAEVPAGAVEAGGGPVPATPAVLALALLGLAGRGVLSRDRGRGMAAPAVVALAVATIALPVAVAPPPATAAQPSTALTTDAAVAPLPTRVRVPAVGVDAALRPVGLDPAGALVPPEDPGNAGWHAGSPAPGATGPAVLTGHVDWAGRPAAFAGLAELARGDEVLVERADGSVVRFRVDTVERHAKDRFPTAAVYAPTSDAQLRLITCGGEFDRAAGSYRDNVVVTATRVA